MDERTNKPGENCDVVRFGPVMLLPRLRVIENDNAELGSQRLYHLLAQARHNLTNYEDLLQTYAGDGRPGLDGLCQWHVEHGGVCTWDGWGDGLQAWWACPSLSFVYWLLKAKATDLGENELVLREVLPNDGRD